MHHPQKGFANIALIIIILVVAGVMGYFVLTRQANAPSVLTPTPAPITAVPNHAPAPVTTPLASQDKTAGWKTYRNEKYGFEVKYPEEFIVSMDSIHNIVIRPKVESDIELTLIKVQRETLTLDQFVHNDTAYPQTKSTYIEDERTTVNAITTYRSTMLLGRGNRRRTFFLKDENSGVDASYDRIKYDNPHYQIFEQILSTFKFIK